MPLMMSAAQRLARIEARSRERCSRRAAPCKRPPGAVKPESQDHIKAGLVRTQLQGGASEQAQRSIVEHLAGGGAESELPLRMQVELLLQAQVPLVHIMPALLMGGAAGGVAAHAPL